MNTALAAIKKSQMEMWDDKDKLEEMKKLICKVKLSEVEFSTFVEMGRATQLNPFLREIWVVKYDEKAPASIFIGRDGYRKAAQRDSEYDYHQCDAVYENDKYAVVNGEPQHEYNLTNRGELIGAYCIAKRHKSSRPMYVFAEVKEYSTGKSLWNTSTGKPATMIKKVAESQCLRACFQDILGGTYAPEEMEREEMHVINPESSDKPATKQQSMLNKIHSAKGKTIESEPVDSGELCTGDQLDEIVNLQSCKIYEAGFIQMILDHYKIPALNCLTVDMADAVIRRMHKLADVE